MNTLDVLARERCHGRTLPLGRLAASSDLEAWWIWRDGEEIEPTLSVMDRDDPLFVAQASLRLELEARD
jgi:hypothetical protein